jgi:acetyl-CoA acetyltransferase
MLVTDKERAREFSRRPEIEIQLIASAECRAEIGYMPEAPALAIRKIMDQTGLTVDQMGAIYDHNPFAVNDVIFAKEFNYDWRKMNDTGCPLVYGHPQGPTLVRVTVEALERVVDQGGGYALVFGCAAGDVGIAALFRVRDSRKEG